MFKHACLELAQSKIKLANEEKDEEHSCVEIGPTTVG